MIFRRFSFKMSLAFLFFSLFFILSAVPSHAYDYGDWTFDGYIKSQFGLFTEGKPFNKAEYGGSNDNIATARQQLRFNVNAQLSRNFGVRAEVLAAWEPEYAHEKGIGSYGVTGGTPPANYYSSFDWRELTIEYKPTYSHTIRFGRQIVNWGEAISGRVVDQCNPVDSRYLLGFTNLEETYIPLWMFRGIHDFWKYNTTLEWIVAPIWQADRFEHSRSMTNAGARYGDGVNYGGPIYRYGANPEGRVSKFNGATMALYMSPKAMGTPARIYGPPFATGYHGMDQLSPAYGNGTVSSAYAANYLSSVYTGYNAYIPGMYMTTGYLTESNVFWSEFPSTDGSLNSEYNRNYTDHNFKSSRWGFKTKHMLWGAELGLSFFQGPAHEGFYNYKYRKAIIGSHAGYLIYEYDVPRYNTFGLFGNYQTSFAMLVFEGAYKPDRKFHKNLYGLAPGTTSGPSQTDAVHEARMGNVVGKDFIHTLFGITREQMVPLLNQYTPWTIRAQWQAKWYLDDMDDVTEVKTYFMTPPSVDNEFLLSLSSSYSFRKYSPSLTFIFNPRGQVYSSAKFTVVPDGFNSRLNFSVGYTNIWGANAYSTRTVLAANNDLAVLTVQYSFY